MDIDALAEAIIREAEDRSHRVDGMMTPRSPPRTAVDLARSLYIRDGRIYQTGVRRARRSVKNGTLFGREPRALHDHRVGGALMGWPLNRG